MNLKQKIRYNYELLWNTYYAGHPLFEKWKATIRRQQNIIILINGATRSGKSTIALDIFEAMDKAAQDVNTIKIRFVFTAKEFMNVINSNLPPGSVIVWEEVGVGLKSKRWYDAINQIVTDVLQVYGHKCFILIMTTPQKRFIDKDARVMTNVYMETNREWLNVKKGTNATLVQQAKTSSKYDKTYFPNYIVDNVKIGRWVFGLPKTPGLIEAYEEHSKGRKEVIERLSEQKAIFHEGQQRRAYMTPEFLAKEILKDPDEYLKKWGGRKIIDKDKVSAIFHVGTQTETMKRANSIVKFKLKKND